VTDLGKGEHKQQGEGIKFRRGAIQREAKSSGSGILSRQIFRKSVHSISGAKKERRREKKRSSRVKNIATEEPHSYQLGFDYRGGKGGKRRQPTLKGGS